MSDFTEADHPRTTDGKFAVKTHRTPTATLLPPTAALPRGSIILIEGRAAQRTSDDLWIVAGEDRLYTDAEFGADVHLVRSGYEDEEDWSRLSAEELDRLPEGSIVTGYFSDVEGGAAIKVPDGWMIVGESAALSAEEFWDIAESSRAVLLGNAVAM